MRIYPHLQDMGGFFVAVLQRKEPSSSSVSEPITGIKRAPSVDPEAGPDSKRLKVNKYAFHMSSSSLNHFRRNRRSLSRISTYPTPKVRR